MKILIFTPSKRLKNCSGKIVIIAKNFNHAVCLMQEADQAMRLFRNESDIKPDSNFNDSWVLKRSLTISERLKPGIITYNLNTPKMKELSKMVQVEAQVYYPKEQAAFTATVDVSNANLKNDTELVNLITKIELQIEKDHRMGRVKIVSFKITNL